MEDDIKQLSSSLKDSLQVTNVKAGTKQGEMPTSVQTLSNAVSSSSDPAQTPSTPSSVGTSTSTQPWLLGTASSPLSVWATSAVNNLSDGPQRNAWDDALNTGTNVRLLVARGERASFQVGVSSQGSVRGLEVAITCSRFNADRSSKSCAIPGTGLNPSCVSLRRIYPPDALVPCAWGARLSMPEEGTVGFWVSIDVPTSQDPGLYQGDLTVAGHVSLLPAKAAVPALRSVADKCSRATSADGPVDLYKALKSVEDEIRRISSQLDHGSRMLLPEVLSVSLEVVDVQIPQCPSFPVLCGLSEEVLENRWQVERNSEEWRTLLCRHFRFMLRYRMCPYFCRWGARGCGMGLVTYTSPFPIGSPMADELLSSPQLCRYVVPFPSDENGAAPLEAEDATAPTHASLKHAQAQPHWAKAMFYLFDEPTTTAEYEKLDLWASRLRETVPKPTVLTTFYCGPKDGTFPEGSWQSLMEVPELLKDSTQVFCVSQWALGEDPSAPRELADTIMHAVGDSGEQWSYVCMGPGSPHPNWHLNMTGGQHRAVAWRAWAEGARGLLYWGANCYDTAAASPCEPITFRRGLPPGDGVLIYPGERYGAGQEPLASVRLERALIGLQDVELLEQHAAKFGRATTVEIMRSRAYSGPRSFTQSWSEMESLRALVARQILA